MATTSTTNTTTSAQVQGIVDSIASVMAEQNNMSPVFTTPIDQHTGIQIEGQFKTNDSTDEGKMSYITVRRSENIAVPFDGYGIGWRKGDGTKYNVYIVDNDALNSDVFINEEQMWDQTGGTNQFLMAAAKEILVDTWYKYVIKIYDKNGMDVWIDTVDTFDDSLLAGDRTIYRGQTYPPYIAQSAGDHFGFGVIETANSEWWYSPVKITSIVETYPMHLFRLKTKDADFIDGDPFTLTYYGVGWGDTVNSLKWFVRNQNTNAWDLCGTGTADTTSTNAEMKQVKALTDIATYRDSEDYVNVLATPYNYEDDEHLLRSYYVSATNTLLSGIHRGNMTDIYINDKTKITTDTQSVTMASQELTLRTNSAFSFPIVDIIGVSRTATGVAFVENVDYSIERPSPGLSFSAQDNIKIVFGSAGIVGISINILYRYYSDGVSVQALLDSDEYRYPGTSTLGKIYPQSIVTLSKFNYKGDVTAEVMKLALIDYINGIEDGMLEYSDLVNAAYSAGATYVDLATIAGTVKDQSYDGTYSTATVTSTYTLSGTLKTFFADNSSMYGINKLD
ncbi:MAG: hypothetical protein H8D23_00830 [Candidatus Brocadiales bacterium]|nr:hypothetical protein [Candidatus Brocadiales bacterium]